MLLSFLVTILYAVSLRAMTDVRAFFVTNHFLGLLVFASHCLSPFLAVWDSLAVGWNLRKS